MKWFKHYTDNYRGRSVHSLFDDFGHIGPCCYYIILELCAEKLAKNPEKDLEVSEFYFGFSQRFLKQNLRISSTKLELFLNKSSTLGLFSFKKIENNYEIFMPILLDLLDSDFKKTRSRRESDASKTPLDIDREIRIDKDKDKELEFTSNQLFDYWNTFENLPAIKTVSSQRMTKMKARLKQFSVDEIKKCFSMILESDFLSGKVKDWRADIDFVIKSQTVMSKILEGGYNHVSTKKTFTGKSQQVFDSAKNQIERIEQEEL